MKQSPPKVHIQFAQTPPEVHIRWEQTRRPVYKSEAAAVGAKVQNLLPVYGPPDSEIGMVVNQDVWVVRFLNDDWQAAYRLAVKDKRIIVGELRILPREEGAQAGSWSADFLGAFAPVPGKGVDADLIRLAKMADVDRGIDVVVRKGKKAKAAGKRSLLVKILNRMGVENLKRASGSGKGGGRKGRPDDYYAKIAAAYCQECAERGIRGANQRVAKSLNLDVAKVTSDVSRARNVYGFIGPTAQGKGGGSLTAKAERVLRIRE